MGRIHSLPGADKLTLEELWQELFHHFVAHGYLRRPRRTGPARADASADWGVRFVLGSVRQARELHELLRQAAYPPAEIVRRHGKWQVRIPGEEAVNLVAELWTEFVRGRGER